MIKITKHLNKQICDILTKYQWDLYKKPETFKGPQLVLELYRSFDYPMLCAVIMNKPQDERIDKIIQELKDIGFDIKQYCEDFYNKKINKFSKIAMLESQAMLDNNSLTEKE